MSRLFLRPYTRSVKFNGTTSALVKATPTGLPTGTATRSASGWIYLTSDLIGTIAQFKINGSNQSVAFACGRIGGTYYYAFDTVNAGNNLTMTANQFKQYFPLYTWLHVAYVATTTTISVYVNNVLVINAVSWGTPINSVGAYDNLFIGKTQDIAQTNQYFFSGHMKDIRIHGALSATDVGNEFYHNTASPTLISKFLMEEGSGTAVADSIGSNSLTASNITWETPTPLLAPTAATRRQAIRPISYSVRINGVDGAPPNALSVVNSPSINPTAAVAVEIWFKPVGPRKAFLLFDNSEAGTTNSYFVSVDATGRTSWFTTVGGVARNLVSSGSLRVKWNEWNFFCGTYTGSAIYLYLNGAKFTEEITGISGSLGVNTGPLRIGAYYTGFLSITFLGEIYRPRIYNVGMTLAEHRDRLFSNLTSSALQAGLVLDAAMTEGAGTTIADVSGNGNTMTLNASASWSTITPFTQRTLAAARSLS